MPDDRLTGNKLFKQIGVDVNFVANNANSQNDKLNAAYWNTWDGRRDGQPQQKPQPQRQVHVAPAQPAQYAPSVDASQIQAYVDAKIMELAAKMQAYADETDQKLNELASVIAQLQSSPQQVQSAPANTTHSQAQPLGQAGNVDVEKRKGTSHIVGAPAQQGRPLDGGAAASKVAEQNNIDRDSVAISKMFNFSHSRNGKIMR
jgi:hypothetical protein